MQVSFQKASDKVDRLEGELSDATPDAAAIEVLQDALANAQDELQRASGVFEDMVLQRDNLNTEARANKTAMEEAQRAVQELEFKLNKAHSTVRKLQGKREDELREKNRLIGLLEGAQQNREVWAEALKKAQEDVDVATEDAKQICPQRVAVPRGKSSEQLLELFERLRATRQQTEKELGGSQDELLRQANEAKKTHKDAMQEFEDIKNLRTVSQIFSCEIGSTTKRYPASHQYFE